MEEEQLQARSPEEGTEAEQAEKRLKTLAVRLDAGLHAQLRFIAQLSGTSISEEIRRAIENRIATAQDDPELIAHAERVREEIEREAAARSAAIAGFMGAPAVSAATDAAKQSSTKSRRSGQPAGE